MKWKLILVFSVMVVAFLGCAVPSRSIFALRLVHPANEQLFGSMNTQDFTPPQDYQLMVMPERTNRKREVVWVKIPPERGEASVTLARVEMKDDRPLIEIEFTPEGEKKFATVTKDHIGERLAIVLDAEALCAPIIREQIPEGRVIIEGFTKDKAEEIVHRLMVNK